MILFVLYCVILCFIVLFNFFRHKKRQPLSFVIRLLAVFFHLPVICCYKNEAFFNLPMSFFFSISFSPAPHICLV
nr:MAG TPA: hypothetical protein [Bacteriophage sp.]